MGVLVWLSRILGKSLKAFNIVQEYLKNHSVEVGIKSHIYQFANMETINARINKITLLTDMTTFLQYFFHKYIYQST